MDSELLKDKIYAKLNEKKAIDLEIIDLAQKSSLADYFVVASGASRIQVKALADDIVELCSKEFELEPKKISGFSEGRWVLMDYGNVVVHLFHPEERDHYKLEQLWQERPISEFIDPEN
ncbi:MAG: ribosome silencing factor [Eubacteriales bacterium]|nr:ribosome silencing factor [Eubacteriales bacterium]